jgi:biotin carboxylase
MRMPATILCLTSYLKGQTFLRACAEAGARTLLLTVEQLRDADWPRDVLADVFLMPELDNPAHVINAASYLARRERFDRIVALDEFDMEMAAVLREHLRVHGMTITGTRAVRDKLVMRQLTQAAAITVPAYAPVFHHADVAAFLDCTPGPWLLKPRMQASAIGIRKLHDPTELWPLLDLLGDRQSHHLLERFVPGDVYHVDGTVTCGVVRIAEVHRYAEPPFDVMHRGGLFCSTTVERDGEEERTLAALLPVVLAAAGHTDGVFHVEFIRAHEDGRYYFLELAARVGGAHIADMVEAATGVNLWAEWARIELAQAVGDDYAPPYARRDYAGVLISLARQEWPDTSAYDDPEVVWRMRRRYHAGLVVASPSLQRVHELLHDYMQRFRTDFFATLPAPERVTD